MTKISIVTAYRKNTQMIKEFLQHNIPLLDEDIEWELIIVNNNNEEDVIETGGIFKLIKTNKDVSFTEVFNNGIREATGDYIIICNNDVFLYTKNFGKILIKQYEENRASIIQPDLGEYWYLPSSSIPNLLQVYREIPNYFWFTKKEDILLFDEVFKDGLFFEDYDYCRTLLRNNKNIFISGLVKGKHIGMGETSNFTKNLRLHNRQVFYDKWGSKCPDWEAGL